MFNETLIYEDTTFSIRIKILLKHKKLELSCRLELDFYWILGKNRKKYDKNANFTL